MQLEDLISQFISFLCLSRKESEPAMNGKKKFSANNGLIIKMFEFKTVTF